MLFLEKGSPSKKVFVNRDAPSGREIATSGVSSTPTAISSDPPPISQTNNRPLDQPNQRRAAKKVVRASSSPDITWRSILNISLISLITCEPFAASLNADVAKGRIS